MHRVKYIEERQYDFNDINTSRYNTPRKTKEQNFAVSNPEVNQSTIALRNLKYTEDNIDKMKRRVSVLQIQQQKNEKRTNQYERKYHFHGRVRGQIVRENKRKMKYLINMQQQLDKSHERIKDYRQQNKQHIKAVKQDLSANKRAQYQRVKQATQNNQDKILQSRSADKNDKILRKNQIINMEEIQRKHIAEYFMHKRHSFRDNSIRQGSAYLSRKSERQKVLEGLNEIQGKMVQRQSESRAALDDSYQKLHKILAKQNECKKKKQLNEKSTSDLSEKLPPVSTRYHNELHIFL